GMVMPISPCLCISFATSNGNCGLWARVMASFSRCACANLRTASANSFCSSVKSKFIARSLRSVSLRLGAGFLHDRGPFGFLVVDVGGVFLGRRGQRLGAVGRELVFQVLGQHGLAQRGIQF